MRTRRLFYENVYLREFEAEVLSCGKDERGQYVVLDQTAFYPEGGGQPADLGTLYPVDGDNKCTVLDVQYGGQDEKEIHHYVDVLPPECQRVRGVLDWERRFDLMQQHSGEHIVSGFVHRKYGYDNVGFHMGEEVITIDLNGLLHEGQLHQIEQEVNNYIWTDRRARVFFPDEEEKNVLPYRSKKELTGEVRLVEFPDGDLCACCGLHVESTGEIGLVKLLSVKHFREGVRIEMAAGKRALGLLHQHLEANSRVASALSVKPGGTPEAVQRLQDEIYSLKGEILTLRQQQFAMRAKQCEGRGNVLLLEHALDAADIRKEADAVLDVCGGICVVIALEDSQKDPEKNNTGGKYAAGQRNGDVRALVKEMNETLSGRGGGKPFFAQGSLQADRAVIKSFFEEKGFVIVDDASGA